MATIFGQLAKAGSGFNLEFERVLSTDVHTLWSAVTDPERLAGWMATYTGDLSLGGSWQALSDDGSVYCTGSVIACDPPHGFTTTWHAIEEEPTTLHITVSAAPDGSRLQLRHDGVQSIYYGAGWQTYLEQLDELLGAAPSAEVDDSRTPGIGWDERFAQLQDAWGARFGALRD